MKHITAFALVSLLGGLAANQALAQQDPIPRADSKKEVDRIRSRNDANDRFDASDSHSEKATWERLGTTQKASEIIGARVHGRVADAKSDSFGKVEDLAIDLESGRVLEVIVATGGWFSGGTRHIGVPGASLTRGADAKGFQLDYDTEKLKTAPAFDVSKWDESVSEERVNETYRYYGRTPYWNDKPERSHRLDNAKRNDADRARSVENVDGKITEPSYPRDNLNRNNDNTSRTGKDRNYANEYSARNENGKAQRMGRLDRASKVIGMTVRNHQDEKLGNIDNLLVDLRSGRIVHVVLSSGGFLGIADELSLVPPGAFKFASDRDSLRLDATKERLSRAPHFSGQSWPDVNDPSYVGGIYQAYDIRPYFETNAPTDSDNTARNVREREGSSVTPFDQGNNDSDISVSRRIRKEVLARENLSVNARNVKIITSNGRVTLKGPVASEAERKLIAEIASNAVPDGNIDNQLEIQNRP